MCYGLTVDGYITCMQEIRERVRERQKEGERERETVNNLMHRERDYVCGAITILNF